MRVSFTMPTAETKKFNDSCSAILTKVGNGSRKGLVESCEYVSARSLEQVPRDTEALANSQFWDITGNYKTGWIGEIGYGKPDYINPRSGKPVSSYMVKVHEDLDAFHHIGKAKFLEDPMREFAKENFPRTVFKYIPAALEE